ncbi:MAG TPA: hypothetical protein GX513_01840 [Firmicutes bacterium]|nr:hypothetical protein [Bacillota bacterium]
MEQLLERKDYGSPKKPAIDWSNPDERQALVQSLVKDARRLVKAVRQRGDAPEELKNAVDFLERVAEQDIEEDDQGRIRIRQGGGEGPGDIHCRSRDAARAQTSSDKTDGYKTHLVAAGKKGEWVTGVETTTANAPDAGKAKELVDQHRARGLDSLSCWVTVPLGSPSCRRGSRPRG